MINVNATIIINTAERKEVVDLTESVTGFMHRMKYREGYRDNASEWQVRDASGRVLPETRDDGQPYRLYDAARFDDLAEGITLYVSPCPGAGS